MTEHIEPGPKWRLDRTFDIAVVVVIASTTILGVWNASAEHSMIADHEKRIVRTEALEMDIQRVDAENQSKIIDILGRLTERLAGLEAKVGDLSKPAH